MRKNGVCEGSIDKDGNIKLGKSIGIYVNGSMDEKKIREDVIPKIENYLERDGKGNYPFIVHSYFSAPSSRGGGLSVTVGGGGLRFRRSSPRIGTKSDDWLITDKKEIFRIKNSKVIK